MGKCGMHSRGQAASENKLTAMLRRPAHHRLQVLVGVTQVRQDGHHSGAGQDVGAGELLHRRKAFFRMWRQPLQLAQGGAVRRVRGVDNAPHHHRPRPPVDLLQQVEVAQDEGRSLMRAPASP
jgi:hypothetical protein